MTIKKEIFFLSFWRIANIEEFKELISDTLRFFSLYVEIEKKYHLIVSKILKQYLTNEELIIEDCKFKFIKSSKKNEIKNIFNIKDIQHLDAINLINVFKDENDILKKNDIYYLEFSDSFKKFLEQILVISAKEEIFDHCQKVEDFNNDKDLQSKEIAYLKQIQNSIFKKHVIALENIRRLNSKNYCYPCFSAAGFPYWFFPIIKKNDHQSVIQYPVKESILPDALRYLDSLLFYSTKKKGTCVNLFPLDNHLIENTYFQIAKKLEKIKTSLERRDYLIYLNCDFYKKLKFILQKYYRETIKILKYIYIYNEAKQLTKVEDILINIKIDLFLDGKKVIPKDQFLRGFKTLQRLGIFIEKEEKFLFPKEIGDNLFLTTLNQKSSDLMIDNGLSITCYYQNITIEDIYFLKAFCNLSFNDYTIEAIPNLNLSSFSWFCKIDDKYLQKRLYENSPDYYNTVIEDQINNYFQTVKYLYHSHNITLYTPAKEKYAEVQFHFSKDEQINHNQNIHFITHKNIIILENKKAFEEFKFFYKNIKLILFNIFFID